jgi:hypothetical protein
MLAVAILLHVPNPLSCTGCGFAFLPFFLPVPVAASGRTPMPEARSIIERSATKTGDVWKSYRVVEVGDRPH